MPSKTPVANEEDDEPWDFDAIKNWIPEPSNFKGYRDKYNFTTAALMQLSFGALLTACSILPVAVGSFAAFITVIVLRCWLELHGVHMTRKEVVFFDWSNLLEMDPPRVQFGARAHSEEECLTPGDGIQRERPGPQTLWDALFTDEKKMRMDAFYREHYGGQYEKAKRKLAEYEAQKGTKLPPKPP